jgi:hypothetical protein
MLSLFFLSTHSKTLVFPTLSDIPPIPLPVYQQFFFLLLIHFLFGYFHPQAIYLTVHMASRTFTVFQDVPATEAVKTKPVTSNVMTTRSVTRSNKILQGSSSLNELLPADKENVHPVTGEHAGVTAMSKKRKTNILSAKPSTPLATKKGKPATATKDAQPQNKKRKATTETERSKGITKKEGKSSGTSRKAPKRVTRKVSNLPRLEEEAGCKSEETEDPVQAAINSRCVDLTVISLADVSQAYEVVESAGDALASSPNKAKFQKVNSFPYFMKP